MKKIQKLLIVLQLLTFANLWSAAENFNLEASRNSLEDGEDFVLCGYDQSGDPVELPENHHDIIYPEINEAKRRLAQEKSLEQRSLILAQVAGSVGYFANQYNLDVAQDSARLVKDYFELTGEFLTRWQYMYEFIIGKTRTVEDPSWTNSEKHQIFLAKAAFKNLDRTSTAQDIDKVLVESHYHLFDDATQQAFHNAVKQQLRIVNIEDICSQYLKTKQIQDFSKQYVQKIFDQQIADQKKCFDQKRAYKEYFKSKQVARSLQRFNVLSPFVVGLSPTSVGVLKKDGLEEID